MPRATNRSPRSWNGWAICRNNRRAHEPGKIHDWVVIYYSRDSAEGHCTVVTATSDHLEGRRVVRSRQNECRQYYRA